jgi:hypothetical protein
MTPIRKDVCSRSGRTWAIRTAGWPCTLTTVCHSPSPDNGAMPGGGCRDCDAGTRDGMVAMNGADGVTGTIARGIPPTGTPPVGGGLCSYCCFSNQVISSSMPWSRPHSANRAATLSVPGARSAPATETPTRVQDNTTTASTASSNRCHHPRTAARRVDVGTSAPLVRRRGERNGAEWAAAVRDGKVSRRRYGDAAMAVRAPEGPPGEPEAR